MSDPVCGVLVSAWRCRHLDAGGKQKGKRERAEAEIQKEGKEGKEKCKKGDNEALRAEKARKQPGKMLQRRRFTTT